MRLHRIFLADRSAPARSRFDKHVTRDPLDASTDVDEPRGTDSPGNPDFRVINDHGAQAPRTAYMTVCHENTAKVQTLRGRIRRPQIYELVTRLNGVIANGLINFPCSKIGVSPKAEYISTTVAVNLSRF